MLDLDQIRERLTTRLSELAVDAREIEAELREPENPDFEERATERENDEVLERLEESALSEIEAIRAALARIKDGTYGICISCGEPVGDKRLDAVPHAAMCIGCASG